MKYLVVDDDNTFRGRLASALEKRGHEVIGASDAKEGRVAAQSFLPERAVVDLRMPGSSGLELISWLKTDHPDIAIIVLTGFGSIATTQDAIKRGALSYLTKPCSIERVLRAFEPSSDTPSIPLPTLEQVEWEHVQRILADCGGNVTHAAKILGMDRRSLQRRLAKAPELQ